MANTEMSWVQLILDSHDGFEDGLEIDIEIHPYVDIEVESWLKKMYRLDLACD